MSSDRRWLPSESSLTFLQGLIQSVVGPLFSQAREQFGRDSSTTKDIEDAYRTMYRYRQLMQTGLVEPAPDARSLPTAVDSPFLEVSNGWEQLVLQDAAKLNFFGWEAVGSVAETMLKASAIGRRVGMNNGPLLYRGEHQSGWPLLSKVGRRLGREPAWGQISADEIEAVERFRVRVEANAELRSEVLRGGPLPHSPMGWMAALQHYDDFGTRMIDVTTSVFAGLYFASVDWNGIVDESVDGRLYCFQSQGQLTHYVPVERWEEMDEFDREGIDVHPTDVAELYKLEHPFLHRIVFAPERNERLLAQDGMFLLPAEPETPWGQHFELRVPAEAKRTILVELWQAGYTPERIVRGERGRTARRELAGWLGVRAY